MKIKRLLTLAAAAAIIAACNEKIEQPNNGNNGNNGNSGGNGTIVNEVPLLPAARMRGAWMATVWGIDWPMGDYSESGQKKLYTDYLDLFKSLGINAVFFQVRGMADAFYKSSYEPWSRYITGTLGKDPGYDILGFLIDEAHKRDMEFHAWINPYRVSTTSYFSEGLNTMIPEKMVKKYEGIWVYNPALPEVRQRIADIVREIISKYDVDGIHMDDYFYPSSGLGSSGLDDSAEYSKYGSGYSSIEDFRRGNIYEMVKLVKQTILSTKPEVAFTIGPQGNYNNNYNSQYIDIPKVCQDKLIDAVIPQLYWSTTASKDYYTPRLEWFSQNISSVPFLVGHTLSGFAGDKPEWSDAGEFETQCSLAEQKSNCIGHLIYNSNTLKKNPKAVQINIRNAFSAKALMPHLGGDGSVPAPAAPENLAVAGGELHWDAVDGARYYAVYKSNGNRVRATLLGTTEEQSWKLSASGKYFVTALDAHNAQSKISVVIQY